MSGKWTRDQQKVIDARNKNLLVSAAAGSGKTAVLIEHILGRILDPSHPVDVDRLLVVTFTRAAAGEMRDRLNNAIEQKLSKEEENEHLVRQLTLLQNAQITTIDSFCSYILKNYFHVIGLDPNYRVMDEGEGKLLKSEVIEELLERWYQEETPEFLQFVECFATGKNDGILEELVLRLYEFSMSYPYPEKWLKESIRAYEAGSVEEFLKADWVEALTEDIRKQLEDLDRTLEEAIRISGETGGPKLYLDTLYGDRDILETLKKAKDYESLYQAFSHRKTWGRLSAKKAPEVWEEKKTLVKALRDQVKDGVKDLEELYFQETPEAALDDLKAVKDPVSVLITLTLEFIQRFEAKKRERNLLDFHDMEHLALSVLVKEEDGKMVPTDTAAELAGQYEEIMIDEYQDSNLVQEAILTAVSRKDQGQNNLFMVGDVKQSIYRFRLARPELFLEKYHTYTLEESPNQRIDLKQNFRSRREILAFTNEIFREVMGEKSGNLVYDEEAALYPGAEYPKVEKVNPEILFLDLDKCPELVEQSRETPQELEARMTGRKILSMVGKEEVFDKETGSLRKMEFRDVAILFRSPAAFAESYGKILGEMGVPVSVGTRSGYFSAREVQVVLALLKIIDNPCQDIPLACVLASPIGNLSDEELAWMKGEAGGDKSFFEAFWWYQQQGEREELKEKLNTFREKLEDFRFHGTYTPIHQLLWYIYDVTGYESFVSAMPGGEQRAQNLKMLVQKAWDYEKTSYRGLFNFIRYIENLQKYDVDYGEAGILGEEKNVVHLMSIHKSKGLEFPVVILGGLEKQFNQQDTRSRLVLDVDLGAGCDLVDPVLRVRRPTLFKRWVQKKVKNDNLGEEIRVLYVALTRARERLILTGAISGLYKKTEGWYRKADPEKMELSYLELTTAADYLDFIMPVLLSKKSAASFLESMDLTPKDNKDSGEDPVWSTDFSIHVLDIQDLLIQEMGRQVKEERTLSTLRNLDTGKVYDKPFHEILSKRMEESSPFGENIPIPVKLTVSQLKRQSEEEAEEEYTGESLVKEESPEPIVPEFLKENTEIKGAARGTAYHIVLQYLDFNGCGQPAMVRSQVNALVESGRLTLEEMEAVDCERIRRLALSSLGKRMAAAQRRGDLYREQHFVYEIPARELYPESDGEKKILIQGVIDAFFEEDGELVLVDYKTDYVPKGGEELLYRKYGVQLSCYQRALSQLTGKKVREKLIYSLFLQKVLSEN